jgi:hypothetical protein
MPIGGEKGSDDKYVSNDELMERIGRVGTLHPVESARGERSFGGPARLFRLDGARGVIGFISPSATTSATPATACASPPTAACGPA